MKKLLIILLLISPFSFADWGDVYYCQMTNNSNVSLEGEATNYKLEKFQFKFDKTKNAMVFGKEGLFKNKEFKLKEGESVPSQEFWLADTLFSETILYKGKFLYSSTGITRGITAISADCDKF
jgi:hypothetical protein